MTRHRRLILLFLLSCLAAPARSATAPAEIPIEQRVVALVFANSMAMWTGSGFVVGDGRWIVTCHHVATRKFGPDKYLTLRDATVISPWTGQAHRARVVAVDQPSDIALLRLDDVTLPSVALAPADFLDRPPALPRPPVQLFGFPSVDTPGWDGSEAAHVATSQGLGMSAWNEGPVLLLAPVDGPARGWSGGPAVWAATKAVVGVFNALISYPERPERVMPQVVSISRLRTFLAGAGVEAASLDREIVPTSKRPSDAAEGFRHLMRITSARFSDDYTTAEREAKALIQLRPTSPEAHRFLGAVLADADKHDEALKALDESRRLAPNVVQTLTLRAGELRALGRRDEAEADLRRAAELDPDAYETSIQLARALTEADRNADARDVLRRALRVAPHHPRIHWDLGLALRRLGETAEGLAECKIAVDLSVDYEPLRPLRILYGRMLAQAGRMQEAEKELREAVRLDSDDAGTHLALASFLADADRKTEARQEAEKALALKPDDEIRQAVNALLKSLTSAMG